MTKYTEVTKVNNINMFNTVNSLQILRVHVAPVGFEVDRIVLPAIKMKADRVWLIIHSEPHLDKGDNFVKLIQAKLKDARIDCLQAQADRIDLFDILRALRTIVLREKGNSILVNVSVGSKIQAIASMMACMMFKDIAMIKPYYVVPERYNSSLVKEDEEKQETEGVKDIIGLPEYKIEIPTDKLIRCLDIISKKTDSKITKRELKDLAIEHNLIYIDDNKKTIGGKKRVREYSDQAAYMTLNKNLIEPLLDWRFITESKIGSHHVVSLTDDGKHALKFLNADI